ncbi:MAG: DUF4231 domain-containing protein [Leptolyngbyaceae bacterium]|nr:DUF4231 domain-containing protein [Leptolyngbyaceae bacterium]
MSKPDPYREWLEKDFGELFATLQLKPSQKKFLRSRWLDQVLWSEAKAAKNRDQYYRLRLTAIVGGVIIPILVSLNINNSTLRNAVRYFTIGFSGIVAVSAAVEEFFRYGERWHHYRRTAESLKTQGWQFSQLSGSYRTFKNHEAAFVMFADRIEEIIQQDVEVFVTQVSQEKQKDKEEQPSASPASASPANLSLERPLHAEPLVFSPDLGGDIPPPLSELMPVQEIPEQSLVVSEAAQETVSSSTSLDLGEFLDESHIPEAIPTFDSMVSEVAASSNPSFEVAMNNPRLESLTEESSAAEAVDAMVKEVSRNLEDAGSAIPIEPLGEAVRGKTQSLDRSPVTQVNNSPAPSDSLAKELEAVFSVSTQE